MNDDTGLLYVLPGLSDFEHCLRMAPGAILVKCRTTSLPCKLNYSPLPGPVPKPVSLELQIVLLLFFSDIEI